MSLKDVLLEELKVNHVKVKVVHKQADKFIVADSSMLAIFLATNIHYEKLIEGKCYMLLKPIKQDETQFMCNEKLKPVTVKDFPVNFKKPDFNQLKNMLSQDSCKKSTSNNSLPVQFKTFEEICKLPDHSEISSVTAKVLSKSKDINGKFGPYNIGKLKYINCEKMDINLYSNRIRKDIIMGDVVELKKLKLSRFVKDGQTVHRLQTTARSSLQKPGQNAEELFKVVPLGDVQENGTVIAVNDIYAYSSCSKCWKKIESNEPLCPCGHAEDDHVIAFHCQFYVQSTKDEAVHVIHTFRRQTKIDCKNEEIESIQNELDEKFTGKQYIFEWDTISANDDDENLRMIFIKKIES